MLNLRKILNVLRYVCDMLILKWHVPFHVHSHVFLVLARGKNLPQLLLLSLFILILVTLSRHQVIDCSRLAFSD